MPATFDQLYARLDGLGVNMEAIGEIMNLTLGQLQELCQRIENLVLEASEWPNESSSPSKVDFAIACPNSF